MLTLLLISNFAVAQYVPTNNVLYVKKGETGNGSSWGNAIGELADALKWAKENESNWASTPLEIWVSSGTYKPMYSPEEGANFGTDQGRDNAFLVVNNVKLYGGFVGTETLLSERDSDMSTNESILSGDVNNDDSIVPNGDLFSIQNNGENNYHILVFSNINNSTTVDGFTVKSGAANGSNSINVFGRSHSQFLGGGMSLSYSSPTIKNIKLSGNYSLGNGAGLHLDESSPTLINLHIIQNHSNTNGGGIWMRRINNPTPLNFSGLTIENNISNQNGGAIYFIQVFGNNNYIYNSKFTNNYAGLQGGAFYIAQTPSYKFINTEYIGNKANNGGAFFLLYNRIIMTNATFYNNSALNMGHAIFGEYNYDPGATFINQNLLDNCIVWKDDTFLGNNNLQEINGQFTLSNSILQYPGSGFNINGTYITQNPEFTDPDNGDLTLDLSSPAVNAGDNTVYEAADGNTGNISLTNDLDLAGNPRLFDTTIDIGAYEVQATLNVPELHNKTFAVYPNPVTNTLNIKTQLNNFDYELFNVHGQKVMEGSSTTSINVSKLNTGIYLLNLSNGNQTENIKIVKE